MLIIPRYAIFLTVLSCYLPWAEGSTDPLSSDVVQFLPDSTIPQYILRDFVDKRHVGEYRVVEIDTDTLRAMIRDAHEAALASTKPTILFPLVDESMVSIELYVADEHHDCWKSGMAMFIGRIAGREDSSVQCLLGPDGSVHLTILISGERHAIRKTSLLPYHIYWTLGKGFSREND